MYFFYILEYNQPMKILDKINMNSESKAYITGVICSIVTLFIVTAVIFLFLIANRLDTVMTQPAGETYTYFMVIMDRILILLIVFGLLPLTTYQIYSKAKSKIDGIISVIASILLIASTVTFFGGEFHYMEKYKTGKLSYSKMFCNPTIETKIFDKILTKQGEEIPKMCLDRTAKTKK